MHSPADGPDLRMQDLVRRTGIPRTTIHFWAREGLLPEPEKSAVNAALYDQRHVDRIRLLDRLRHAPLGPLPLALVRRVVELVELGVEADVAVSLERSVLGSLPPGGDAPLSTDELGRTAGVPPDFIQAMRDADLLVPPPGDPVRWDALDVQLVRVCHALVQGTGLPLAVARPISHAIRDLSRFEMGLRNQAVAGLDHGAASELTARIQEGINLIHAYLFYRWRLHDIATLGQDTQPPGDPDE